MNEILPVVILASCVLFFLFCGFPIPLVIGGVGVIFGFIFWDPSSFLRIGAITYSNMTSSVLMSVPLFLFMGYMLSFSGIGESFYNALYCWMGRIKGGLAIGTIFSLTAIAAMTPSGTGTILMASIAVPGMVDRGYDKKLAMGTILAGGMLGMLIVPSILIIFYCSLVGESVGGMFAGAAIPGLLMAFLFAVMISILCYFKPELGPPIKEKISWNEKFKSLKGVIFPVFIILSIIIGIYTGTFTPTEASSIGATGALIGAFINRQLTRENFFKAAKQSLAISGMCFWLLTACGFFGSVFAVMGAQDMISDLLLNLPGSRWWVIIAMQLSLFVLCMFIDDYPVMVLFAPIYVPIIRALDFNSLWFGVMFIVNMNIAWLTPPYGMNVLYGKVIAPEMPMGDIYRSVIPFIFCQLIVLALIMIFPDIALWLPRIMGF